MRSIRKIREAVLILAVLATGCGFVPDRIIKFPDSPVLIGQARGNYVRVLAYSKLRCKMVELGWVPLTDYTGWTLTKYDWEARAEKDRGGTGAESDGESNP